MAVRITAARPLAQMLSASAQNFPSRIQLRRFSEERTSSTSRAGRGEPAAAVPNSPSPFQLTPDLLKQQTELDERSVVPQDHRGYDPKSLLAAFKRSCETKISNVDELTWDDLFHLNSQKLDKMGLNVKDRKYILWCLEKFRSGEDPKKYAKEPPPKKTQRGWGPPVRKKKPASS